MTGGDLDEDQGTKGQPGGQEEERVWHDVQLVQIQGRGTAWQYEEQECPVVDRREVGEGSARDKRQKVGWEGVLGLQKQQMEYEEVPEGAGKGEPNWMQEGGGLVGDKRARSGVAAAAQARPGR